MGWDAVTGSETCRGVYSQELKWNNKPKSDWLPWIDLTTHLGAWRPLHRVHRGVESIPAVAWRGLSVLRGISAGS